MTNLFFDFLKQRYLLFGHTRANLLQGGTMRIIGSFQELLKAINRRMEQHFNFVSGRECPAGIIY